MPNTLNPACPLCGLRFENQPIMDLHMREDHRRRAARESIVDGGPGITRSPATGAGNLADANEPAAAPSRTSATATATAEPVEPAEPAEPAGRRGRAGRAKAALCRTLRILR
jgi:hypothetical protein